MHYERSRIRSIPRRPQSISFYNCVPMTRRYPLRKHSALGLRRRRSALRRNFICSDVETNSSLPSSSSSSSSIGFEAKPIFVEITSEIDSETIDSTEKETDLAVITDTDLTDSGRVRVDPVQETEESTVSDAVSPPPPKKQQLRERNRTDGSPSLLGIVFKAIEFQFNLMTRLLKSPPFFLLFPFDPFTTFKLGRRFLLTQVSVFSEMLFRTLKLTGFKDTKHTVNVACKFGWGLFRAFYVGVVLFGLLVSAFVLGGFVINRVADKPFVIKEVLSFDYTKNSPEAFVPITSCAGGVACGGSCEESNEVLKIKGLRGIPRDHKLEITLSLTLPESYYNKNLGMFQVRVDFLSADGQTLDTIRRPCMLRFRSEPIRLVQTFFKVVPLVTGYVSEIQTLTLKLKGFAEKDTPTACLKVMIEQRAEFRPGAGIPELYDASLSLESDLPFFKRVVWKWRRTLFVWISMSLFFTKLLFALVFCRSLIIPRTRLREVPASNPIESRW
ncbi:Seipin-2 [Hirschfeldia incana]|nr:Seipin-2 [Hirschfeldia incana]